MLSKKMTFLLMSLITIIALAFVAPSADADPVEVTIEGLTKYRYGEAAAGTAITVTVVVKTDSPVTDFTPTVATVRQNGALGPVPEITAQDAAAYPDLSPSNRRFTFDVTPGTGAARIVKAVFQVPVVTAIDRTFEPQNNMSEQALNFIVEFVSLGDATHIPKVVSIQRLSPVTQTVVSAFQEVRIDPEPFNIRVVLTEAHSEYDSSKTADENAKRLIEVENGTASALFVGKTFLWDGRRTAFTVTPAFAPIPGRVAKPHPSEGMYEHTLPGVPPGVPGSGFVPLPTGADDRYYQYLVRITPHQKLENFDLKIRVKPFHDGGSPIRSTYLPPDFVDSPFLPQGREILTVPVKGSVPDLTAGYKVEIPKDWIIPANGYLVIAKNTAGSEIDTSGQDADRTDDTPRETHRIPAQLKYNVIEVDTLPNLATQFLSGVVVDVQSQHPGLVISEVMWGEDVSLNLSTNSQYIELYNPGDQYKTIDDKDDTRDINEVLTLIFYAPNEFSSVPAVDADGDLPAGITDRVGTLGATGAYWSPASKGQSGRSGTDETESGPGRTGVSTTPLVSMYRVMDTAGEVTDGQAAASWASSEGPKSANFDPLATGIRHGTPGAATDATRTPADAAAEAKAAADKAAAASAAEASTGTILQHGSVYISEVMFAGGGVLPQWIEIANGSKSEEINLSGWTLTIDNAAADADVSIGASATFTIPDGTTIDPTGQIDSPSTLLIVTEVGRNNVDASGQVVNLWRDNEVELILAGVTTRKYTILSSEAFSITLAPPEPLAKETAAEKTARLAAEAKESAAAKAVRLAAEKKAKVARIAASDTVGNLGVDGAAAWALPVNEEGRRSSLIRRHVQVSVGPAAPEDGTLAENWVLASDTSFAQPTHILAKSYYGAQNDVGTPGFRAGGALPVELSHFRPARDKSTGAVVITWSTESELNNAGFFIKRAQQKDGEFTVVNAAMVPGAGTTSEKQFYTYTDTTAQPSVVYYYQIEDVSLDGNRQTLTRGIRLKGHVGAAGKAATTWADLKASKSSSW